MKRKRKLIPLELQKQADKILGIVPELQSVDGIDREHILKWIEPVYINADSPSAGNNP